MPRVVECFTWISTVSSTHIKNHWFSFLSFFLVLFFFRGFDAVHTLLIIQIILNDDQRDDDEHIPIFFSSTRFRWIYDALPPVAILHRSSRKGLLLGHECAMCIHSKNWNICWTSLVALNQTHDVGWLVFSLSHVFFAVSCPVRATKTAKQMRQNTILQMMTNNFNILNAHGRSYSSWMLNKTN